MYILLRRGLASDSPGVCYGKWWCLLPVFVRIKTSRNFINLIREDGD